VALAALVVPAGTDWTTAREKPASCIAALGSGRGRGALRRGILMGQICGEG